MTSLAQIGLRLLLLQTCFVVGCTGFDGGESSNGSMGDGGTDSGDGGTPGSGGALIGGDGDGDDGAGGAGTGGAALPTGGTTGEILDTVNCDPVDPARLFPQVGPFLSGPNPGPCNDSNGSVYLYEDGLVSAEETYGETYERDGTGRLIRIVRDFSTTELSYAAGLVTWTNPNDMMLNTMTLDERGYPQTLTIGSEGAVYGVFDYVYEDCLLVARKVAAISPEYQPSVFTYDASSNLVSRTYGDETTTFDYSCW